MTRILITSLQVSDAASKGHLNPLIGVVQWLVRSGARVGWLALPHAMGALDRRQVEALGVDLIDTPPLPAGVIPGERELARRAMDPARVWEVYRSFLLDPVDHLIDAVRARVRAFAPDAVASDGMCYTGILAAHAERLPWAGIGAGLKILKEGGFAGAYAGDLERLVSPRAETFARHGMRAEFRLFECVSPHANVVFTTRALAGDRALPPRTHLVGPTVPPAARGDETDFPFDALAPGRPVVYVAFGSVHTNLVLDDVNRAIGAAARALGAQLVVSSAALAGAPPPPELPPGAIVRAYVPQPALLERAHAFVTHGGANSVMEGLYAGVPLLVVPLSSDQPWQARLVEEAGVGEAIARGELTPERVRDALARLLAPDGAPRRRAGEVQASYRAADGARAAARWVLDLAGQRPGGL